MAGEAAAANDQSPIKLAQLGLRAAEAIFGIIVLGTMAKVVAVNNQIYNDYPDYYADKDLFKTPSEFGFLLFCGLWGMIIAVVQLAVTLVLKLEGQQISIGQAALDGLTAIFFFAGFIAAAARLNASNNVFFGETHTCSDLPGDYVTYCQCLQTGIVFGAFSWVLWTVSAVLSAMPLFGNLNLNLRPSPSTQPVAMLLLHSLRTLSLGTFILLLLFSFHHKTFSSTFNHALQDLSRRGAGWLGCGFLACTTCGVGWLS